MAIDPSKHADRRGWIESILRYIPGYHGYIEKEYRRESDALTRTHLTDRLMAAKRNLNEYQRTLVDAVKLDDLPAVEGVVSGIDTLVHRIKGDVHGYSGFFDFVQVQEDELDRVYEHDLQLVTDVEAFVNHANAVGANDEPRSVASQLKKQLDAISEKYSLRTKILTGLEETPPQ